MDYKKEAKKFLMEMDRYYEKCGIIVDDDSVDGWAYQIIAGLLDEGS